MGARTGSQFLEGLHRKPRRVYLDGERVGDVTQHPSLKGAAYTVAEVFDRQHAYADECLILDPET